MPVEKLILALRERTKELNCLYEIEELFSHPSASLDDILSGVAKALPAGWQYPDVCRARIVLENRTYESPGFTASPWMQSADIVVEEERMGEISVFYTEARPPEDEGPFLKEERKLINTIADRLQRRIFYEKLKGVFEDQQKTLERRGEYRVIIDLLKRTDSKLLAHISRKMLNYLSWSGVEEANTLLERFGPASLEGQEALLDDINRPSVRRLPADFVAIADDIFKVANTHLGEKELLDIIQKWMMEDRTSFFVKILEDPSSTLTQIINSIERFHHLTPQGLDLPGAREKTFCVSLVRKLLNEDLKFINIAKNYLEVNDFYALLHRVIFPAGSIGKLGGKGAGLFLASRILKKAALEHPSLAKIRTPKTWYLTSDTILQFINHNDLEELLEQKYKDISQVRQEYPYVVHVFKNSSLPPEIVNGLSVALDDLNDTPLIVRSSSLLEDRMGATFAGKYKSLFIANQGTKRERLLALMDAIVEVYASTFSPDPIEYRVEHGMLDFHEEMGILIQEVVGRRVGDYYLPAFAGVALSHNEFRWSPRIRREDGLMRVVPGLGTRAVDRLSDDYPILISPGQPNLQVNVTTDEKIHYSPRKIDVINLRTNTFETIDIRTLLREFGPSYPRINELASIARDDRLDRPTGLGIDFEKDFPVITFDGIVQESSFIEDIRLSLEVLEEAHGAPVDIEFAHDGIDLYLLQCRPQSYSVTSQPVSLPHNLPPDRILFTANRDISNGIVSDITHIVYVDPQRYGELSSRSDLLAVGRAVSRLNQMLPKRQFLLMGPGRWGSRGDIKLGVNVTYSDINNTAMLVEIAKKHREYMPEPSFGTHFFQDLVEASIRYLPLFPDIAGVVFNEQFLLKSRNVLATYLPEYASLADTIHVISLAESAGGLVLNVMMNGEEDEAVGFLTERTEQHRMPLRKPVGEEVRDKKDETHWRWRARAAERMAAQLDGEKYGVRGIYLLGSTKNATAGPQSDIDLLIHFEGTETQKKELDAWLDGWSLCLAEMNYLKTGHKSDRLLDVHYATPEDIRSQTSFSVKIGAVTDAARPLTMLRPMKS